MENSSNKKYFLLVLGFIVIACFCRFFPHILNFSPIAAIALFGGVYFKSIKWAVIAPISCLFVTDLIMQGQFLMGTAEYPGFYSSIWAVYLSFMLVVGLGVLLKNKLNAGSLLLTSIVGSILFFLVTNFGSWLALHDLYPVKNIESLMYSYQMGLPFFRGTLLGDLFFNGVLFGSFYAVRKGVFGVSTKKNVIAE